MLATVAPGGFAVSSATGASDPLASVGASFTAVTEVERLDAASAMAVLPPWLVVSTVTRVSAAPSNAEKPPEYVSSMPRTLSAPGVPK
jgi:hypothetical protein